MPIALVDDGGGMAKKMTEARDGDKDVTGVWSEGGGDGNDARDGSCGDGGEWW